MICLWIGKGDIENGTKRKGELEIDQSEQYEGRGTRTGVDEDEEEENSRRKTESIYILQSDP